jgi:hypothetical protein
MATAKKNMLLLTCLLMIVWMIAGLAVRSDQAGGRPAPENKTAASSMNANGVNFDFIEASSALLISQIGQEPFRLPYSRSGAPAVAAAAVLLTVVFACLKLFRTVDTSFDSNSISDYIHDQDGMK